MPGMLMNMGSEGWAFRQMGEPTRCRNWKFDRKPLTPVCLIEDCMPGKIAGVLRAQSWQIALAAWLLVASACPALSATHPASPIAGRHLAPNQQNSGGVAGALALRTAGQPGVGLLRAAAHDGTNAAAPAHGHTCAGKHPGGATVCAGRSWEGPGRSKSPTMVEVFVALFTQGGVTDGQRVVKRAP